MPQPHRRRAEKIPGPRQTPAQHNLAVTIAEIARVRAAVQDGTLFELVDERCRAHPKLLDGYRRMLERIDEIARFDRASKRRFFYRGDESCKRPEVALYHKMVSRIELGPEVLLAAGGPVPSRYKEVIEFKPPFGPLPYELAETFPAGQAEIPSWDATMVEYGIKGMKDLMAANPQTKLVISASPKWQKTFEDAFASAEFIK
jgi:Queuine/archaeosine tRNA-ribosyltransferase